MDIIKTLNKISEIKVDGVIIYKNNGNNNVKNSGGDAINGKKDECYYKR